MANMTSKRLSVRIDGTTSAKLDFLITCLGSLVENNSTSSLIKYLIDAKFDEVSTGMPIKPNDISMDENRMGKIDYIFEYLELMVKVDPNIKAFFLDANNNEKEELIDRYVNASSRFRKYIERKIELKVNDDEQG